MNAYEPETKPQSTVWVIEDEPNPAKKKHFGKTGHVATVPLGQQLSSPEDTLKALKNHVLEVYQSEWKKCFDM